MIDYLSYLLLEKMDILKRVVTITWHDGQLRTSFDIFRYGV